MHLSEREANEIMRRRAPRDVAYAARIAARKNKPKYGNHKIESPDGMKFDSKAEYRRYCHLATLAKAKRITNLRRQVPYELVPPQVSPDGTKLRPVLYLADMVYIDGNGVEVVEDVKGVDTAEYRIKKKLMLERHGIWVREIRS